MRIKPSLTAIFGFWLAIMAAVPDLAADPQQVIEPLPNGYVDWTQGLLVVKSTSGHASENTPYLQGSDLPDSELIDRARHLAADYIMQSLNYIRVDHQNKLSDLMASDEQVRGKFREMSESAAMLYKKMLQDGSVEIAVQMPLHGGLAQLILPAEIRQVESIKAVNGAAVNSGAGIAGNAGETGDDPDANTGLIVDARGVGATPALVPRLLDETGREVYSPAFISREFAVQKGTCKYIRAVDADLQRVGRNPLLIKGLRTVGPGSCDIIISNADASRLHSSSAHLNFLKQCRVIIMVE